MPGGLSLLDLGLQSVKDIPDPEHIFHLVGGDFRSDFLQLWVFTHKLPNLSSPATSFIGREHEFERAATLPRAVWILRRVIQNRMLPFEREKYDQVSAALLIKMNEQKIEFSWSDGRAMKMEQAIKCALADSE